MNPPHHILGGPVHGTNGWSVSRPLGWVLSALFMGLALLEVQGATQTQTNCGVTILVHGFTPRDGKANPPFEYWAAQTGENLAMLLRRFGSGLVWVYDPATGLYTDISRSGRIPEDGWNRSVLGEQILLFDWTDVSDELESGQAEAAADALFASLMRFEVGGERIMGSSPYRAKRPLHFVGHSRGTAVVSETVQRLGRFNIQVDYVTYLDIHDFGQDPIPKDEFFHDPAVQVWDNVAYADVFFQTNHPVSPVPCSPNPSGRPLAHFSPGPLQRDVTSETASGGEYGDCDMENRPHSWVKNYYWKTVHTNGIKGFGFNRWFDRGGYGQGREPSIQRTRCTVVGEAVEFVWLRDLSNDRMFWDRNDVPRILFNGDFELPDLDRGIGGTDIGSLQPHSLAGWSHFGGGGRADVHPEVFGREEPGQIIPNSFLVLNGTALEARHNRFYLPTTAREILFALSVPYVPVTPAFDETLEVRIGNRVLRRFTVAETEGFEVRRVDLSGDPDLLGGVNTLTFELFAVPGPSGLTAKAFIDNVDVVTDSLGWIESVAKEPGGNLKIRWQSWPSATFQLLSSPAISGATWTVVTENASPATAGEFTIPVTEGGQRFYRGKVFSSR